jgi:hypothetical protein
MRLCPVCHCTGTPERPLTGYRATLCVDYRLVICPLVEVSFLAHEECVSVERSQPVPAELRHIRRRSK